jgi:hypothetical protein
MATTKVMVINLSRVVIPTHIGLLAQHLATLIFYFATLAYVQYSQQLLACGQNQFISAMTARQLHLHHILSYLTILEWRSGENNRISKFGLLDKLIGFEVVMDYWTYIVDTRLHLLQKLRQLQELRVFSIFEPAFNRNTIIDMESVGMRRIIHQDRLCTYKLESGSVIDKVELAGLPWKGLVRGQ